MNKMYGFTVNVDTKGLVGSIVTWIECGMDENDINMRIDELVEDHITVKHIGDE